MQYSNIRRDNASKWQPQFACKSVCYGLAAGLLFSAGGACAAQNQSAAAEQIYSETEGWHLGIAAGYGVLSNPLFQRDDIPLYLVPRLEYFNGDFSWTNSQLAWTPLQTAFGNFGLITQLNSDGLYFISDKHIAGLLAPVAKPPANSPGKDTALSFKRGNIEQISRRHLSYEAGLNWTFNTNNWHFGATVLQDISSVHNGSEAFLHTEYLWQRHSANLALGLELHYQSNELVRYYYGTNLQDMRAGFSRYLAQSSLNVALGARYQYSWNDNWRMISEVKYQWLGDSIQHSPLVDDAAVLSAFVGIAWTY